MKQITFAALIMIPSGLLWILARVQLGEAFALMPQAKALVTSGLYSKIRHPIYVFSTLTIFGFLLSFENTSLLWLLLPIIILAIVRAKKEEQVLEAKFGQAYLEYKNQTWF